MRWPLSWMGSVLTFNTSSSRAAALRNKKRLAINDRFTRGTKQCDGAI